MDHAATARPRGTSESEEFRKHTAPGSGTDLMPSLDAETAVRAELDAAQAVLDRQAALTHAMGEGQPAPQIEALTRALVASIDQASQAARRRAALLPDRAAVEGWIASEPARASARRALIESARRIRSAIDREAKSSAYLARRVALWNETQRAWIAEAVLRETRAEGYGPAGRGGLAANLDKMA